MENIVLMNRPQMTTWYMHIACFILKARDTIRTCNTYSFSTAIMVAQTCQCYNICTMTDLFYLKTLLCMGYTALNDTIVNDHL